MITEAQQKKIATKFEMFKTPLYSVIKDRHTWLHQGLEGGYSIRAVLRKPTNMSQ